VLLFHVHADDSTLYLIYCRRVLLFADALANDTTVVSYVTVKVKNASDSDLYFYYWKLFVEVI